jgi:heme-degrading monooxygenase HmoA
MYVGFALFRFKKGQGKFALKHMRKHLNTVKQVKGFIHGYVAKSIEFDHEYLVIEEYETKEAQEEAQNKISKEATLKPNEYIKFGKIMKEKPRIEIFKKKEVTHGKITATQKKMFEMIKKKDKLMKAKKKKLTSKKIKKKTTKKKTIKKKVKKIVKKKK